MEFRSHGFHHHGISFPRISSVAIRVQLLRSWLFNSDFRGSGRFLFWV